MTDAWIANAYLILCVLGYVWVLIDGIETFHHMEVIDACEHDWLLNPDAWTFEDMYLCQCCGVTVHGWCADDWGIDGEQAFYRSYPELKPCEAPHLD